MPQDDNRNVFEDVAGHIEWFWNQGHDIEEQTASDILDEILDTVPVPKGRGMHEEQDHVATVADRHGTEPQ